jgi:5-methylcytosine-specific restriction endonuclease McrA
LLDWDAGIDGDPGDQYGRALTELVDRGMIYWALPPAHNVILINECLMHGDIGYREYLRSDWWRAQVIYARERAGNRCQLCNDGQALSVHHRTYERLGYEAEQDLIVLCRACHAKFHDKLPAHPDGGRSNAQEQA